MKFGGEKRRKKVIEMCCCAVFLPEKPEKEKDFMWMGCGAREKGKNR